MSQTFNLPDNAVLRLPLPGNRTLAVKHGSGGTVVVAQSPGQVVVTITGTSEHIWYE